MPLVTMEKHLDDDHPVASTHDVSVEEATRLIELGVARLVPPDTREGEWRRVVMLTANGLHNPGEICSFLMHEAADLVGRGLAAWHPEDDPNPQPADAGETQPDSSPEQGPSGDVGGEQSPSADPTAAQVSPTGADTAGAGDGSDQPAAG